VEPTRRAHARALALLERYGVVSRDALSGENIAGGFGAVYPVYRQMEESGKLRRGHFVEGLPGAQFAYAGAVDRLRAARPGEAEAGEEVVVLAATDPAQPYGALLPWPATRSAASSPRRAVGASVVLVAGEPLLFIERGGHRLQSFPIAEPSRDAAALARAAGALQRLFAERRRASLRLEQIDGEPALRSPLADVFAKAGFRADYKGLVLDRYEAQRSSD
jgi:ATP-dependent Lhr-like helicase